MSLDNSRPADCEKPLFSAVLTPHRSLGRSGFVAVMAVVAGFSFLAGLVFFLIGAWPVLGFLGLDVALIYWAFQFNYRAAGAYEEITVTPSELKLRKVTHHGDAAEWILNPLWTRLERETDEDFGVTGLFLISQGRRIAVAGCLAPDERESFAESLSRALGEVRRGVTRNAL